MSNNLINALNKCKIANVLKISDDQFIIKKHTELELIISHFYNVEVANYIINEPPNFTLSCNWNNGTVPPETNLNIQVLDIQGNMIKVDAIGVSTNKVWEGWLPKKSIVVKGAIK